MNLRFLGIPSRDAERLRAGAPDANGQAALVRRTEGLANPCRHCLQLIEPGSDKLVAGYRPFAHPQPYAETGPIFLHPQACERYAHDTPPAWFAYLTPAIIRGYGFDDWIRYETGAVVAGAELARAASDILADPEVAYVHIRSKFNCFQCRVERAAESLEATSIAP